MSKSIDEVARVIAEHLHADPHFYDDPNAPTTIVQYPGSLDRQTFENLQRIQQAFPYASRSSNSVIGSTDWQLPRPGLRKVTISLIIDDATGEVYVPSGGRR